MKTNRSNLQKKLYQPLEQEREVSSVQHKLWFSWWDTASVTMHEEGLSRRLGLRLPRNINAMQSRRSTLCDVLPEEKEDANNYTAIRIQPNLCLPLQALITWELCTQIWSVPTHSLLRRQKILWIFSRKSHFYIIHRHAVSSSLVTKMPKHFRLTAMKWAHPKLDDIQAWVHPFLLGPYFLLLHISGSLATKIVSSGADVAITSELAEFAGAVSVGSPGCKSSLRKGISLLTSTGPRWLWAAMHSQQWCLASRRLHVRTTPRMSAYRMDACSLTVIWLPHRIGLHKKKLDECFEPYFQLAPAASSGLHEEGYV